MKFHINSFLPILSLAASAFIKVNAIPVTPNNAINQFTPGVKEFKLAIIGDSGAVKEANEVMKLSPFDILLHLGDYDYEKHTEAYFEKILDSNRKYQFVGVLGNHEEICEVGKDGFEKFKSNVYREMTHKTKNSKVSCVFSSSKVMWACTYENMKIIGLSVYIDGADDRREQLKFLKTHLNQNTKEDWKICAWHYYDDNYHTGYYEKHKNFVSDDGENFYDYCKEQGAFIFSAHDHVYARTHVMSKFGTPTIDSYDKSADIIQIRKGATFNILNGVGGWQLYTEKGKYKDFKWWRKTYALKENRSNRNNFGGVFCNFNVGGNSRKASCEFQIIRLENKVYDSFTIYRNDDPGNVPYTQIDENFKNMLNGQTNSALATPLSNVTNTNPNNKIDNGKNNGGGNGNGNGDQTNEKGEEGNKNESIVDKVFTKTNIIIGGSFCAAVVVVGAGVLIFSKSNKKYVDDNNLMVHIAEKDDKGHYKFNDDIMYFSNYNNKNTMGNHNYNNDNDDDNDGNNNNNNNMKMNYNNIYNFNDFTNSNDKIKRNIDFINNNNNNNNNNNYDNDNSGYFKRSKSLLENSEFNPLPIPYEKNFYQDNSKYRKNNKENTTSKYSDIAPLVSYQQKQKQNSYNNLPYTTSYYNDNDNEHEHENENESDDDEENDQDYQYYIRNRRKQESRLNHKSSKELKYTNSNHNRKKSSSSLKESNSKLLNHKNSNELRYPSHSRNPSHSSRDPDLQLSNKRSKELRYYNNSRDPRDYESKLNYRNIRNNDHKEDYNNKYNNYDRRVNGDNDDHDYDSDSDNEYNERQRYMSSRRYRNQESKLNYKSSRELKSKNSRELKNKSSRELRYQSNNNNSRTTESQFNYRNQRNPDYDYNYRNQKKDQESELNDKIPRKAYSQRRYEEMRPTERQVPSMKLTRNYNDDGHDGNDGNNDNDNDDNNRKYFYRSESSRKYNYNMNNNNNFLFNSLSRSTPTNNNSAVSNIKLPYTRYDKYQ